MTKKTLTLLLIEDNPGDARLIQEMVAETAAPGELTLEICALLSSGLQRLAEDGIDLILLDLSLPDSYGLDTLRRVLRQTAVPVVVLTGLNDQSVGVTAVHEGAQDYLIKGDINSQLLVRSIRYAVERHQIDQDRQKLIGDLEAFAHSVAHDLKAPLGPLVLAGEMLESNFGELSPEEIRKCGHIIAHSSRKMGSIIDELLLLASVRSQEVSVSPLAMTEIFNQAQERLAALIESHQASISSPYTWPTALGYAPWVEEVWVNYLSNAIKYGGEPPEIDVGATLQANGMVRFWIHDNGRGLSVKAQTGLFVPFKRLEQAKIEGHGLGLSIVRRIIEKLGGEIGVNSKPGQGSTFMFTLPGASAFSPSGY